MSPKVSVLLSVYNGEKYIKEATESILNQTFSDFEFIIINDGSTDGTAVILNEFKDPRIVILTNEKNLGLAQSLNVGLERARGEYIARMDADDISKGDRLERQVTFLDKNTEIGVLGTYMEQIDAKGRFLSFFEPPRDHMAILHEMLFGTAVAHATTLMRRKVLLENRGYDPNFPHTEDLELWSRLILKTKFANLPEVLYTRRIHSGSIMSQHSQFQIVESEKVRGGLLQSLIGKKILSDEEITKIIEQKKHEQHFFKKAARGLKNLLPVTLRHRLRGNFKRFLDSFLR